MNSSQKTQSVLALMNQAVQLQKQNAFESAKILYQTILKKEQKNTEALHSLGTLEAQLGNFQQAIALFTQLIKLKATHIEAHYNRAVVLGKMDKLHEALLDFEQTVQLKPNYAEAHYNIGVILEKLGPYEQAVESYQTAIEFKPDLITAYFNCGVTLRKLGLNDKALAYYNHTIELAPRHVRALYNRSNIFRESERLEDALADLNQAIQFEPNYAEAFSNRGDVLTKLGRIEEALADYERAIQLKPQYVEAFINQGITLQTLYRLDAALISYERALELDPTSVLALNNKGNLFRDIHRFDEALASYQQAVLLDPTYADSFNNLGNILRNLHHLDEAMNCYDKALQLKPNYVEAIWNSSLTLLLKGDFREGWQRFEKRWEGSSQQSLQLKFSQPVWLGDEDITGKTLLIHTEQGLGDSLQFCRYIHLLKHKGAKIILVVEAPLLKIFSSLTALTHEDRILIKGEQLPAFDFYCLQKGDPAETEFLMIKDHHWQKNNLHVLTHDIHDWTDTAGLIHHLDLIIGVDTSTIHLAGAMGKTVWLLNRFDTCWRWLLDRENSPWYPTMRIFCQPKLGDWDSVMKAVNMALTQNFLNQIPSIEKNTGLADLTP